VISALRAAEGALANPLLGDISIQVGRLHQTSSFLDHTPLTLNPCSVVDTTQQQDAKGLIVSITGGSDLTLFEVDEAAERVTRVRQADCMIHWHDR
jgi:hypothetical protein